MGARASAWAMCAEWATASEIAGATGYRKQSVTAALRAMASEGRLERRFADGIGDQYRRAEGAEPPREPPQAAGEAIMALLAERAPMTAPEIMREIPRLSPSGVRMALSRLERSGRAVRDRSVEPHEWRLAE